jgi:hypothetical protein
MPVPVYRDNIYVTVFQIPHDGEFINLFDRKLYMRYLEPEKYAVWK